MKNNFILLLTFFCSHFIIGQNLIFDSNNKKPISSVSIQYQQNKGIITNEDGFFELSNIENIDTLYLSHISYKQKKIAFKSLIKKDTIFLEPLIINLDEITISNLEPKTIIRRAIKKIDENYINTPHNLFGFFRQTLKEDNKGVEMIEVDFISYLKDRKSQSSTKVLKARRTNNYSKLNLKTHGGVSSIIENGDFVKRKSDFLDISNIENYEFIYDGILEYNNLNVYKISFKPIDNNNLQVLRKGSLFIDSKSLAIIEIIYTFDDNKLSKITNQADLSLSTREPVYILKGVKSIIKYIQLPNKKWVLSYIESNNIRKGIYKNEEYTYDLSVKLIINNIKTKEPSEVKTNYNLSKDFNKAVKRYDKLEEWDDNYKLSLSNRDLKILNDINEKKKDN